MPRFATTLRRTPLAFAVATISLAGAPGLRAQAADAEARRLDTIVVTGTRARDRTVRTAPVAIDVLTREDIRRAGVVGGELGQALGILLPSFNFPRQSNSGGSDHIRAAQLRGLSPDQVLVLINGRRRHTSAVVNTGTKIGKGTAPVDFNSIPISAVARIEVLRDGAGAQYGSDAIAGVINVILDDSVGTEASVSFGVHRTDVEPIDRKLTDGQTLVTDASWGTTLGDNGFLRAGVEFKQRDQNNRAGFDQIPFFEEQTPANLAQRGRVNYRIGDPQSTDRNAWFNLALPVAAGGEFYSFGTFNSRDTLGAAFFRYPDGRSNIRAVYPNGFRPDTVGDNRDTALTGGWRGAFGAWDIDASLGWGQNDFTFGLERSLNASLGTASPTRFRLADYRYDQWVAVLDARRDLAFDAFASPLSFATGIEYRGEQFVARPGDPASYAVGPLTDRAPGAQAGPGLTPADAADVSRDVASIYADLSGDVGERLFANAALRYERYDDFGGEFAGKLAARFALADGWAVRAALSNNLRAPTLAQTAYQDTSNDFGEGGQVRSVRTLSVASPIARALGARALEPETSVNASLGLTVDLAPSFNLALDAFRIRIDDRITLSERISGPRLTEFIRTRFGLAGIDGVNYFTNAVDTETTGADLVATWRTGALDGDLTLQGAYGYARTSIERVAPTPLELVELGISDVIIGVEEINTLTSAAPRQKAVLDAAWSRGGWEASVRGIRHGATTRVFNFGGGFVPTQTYDARWQVDAELGWQVTEVFRAALGVSNLTDAYPERSSDDINYFGNLPYDILSGIGVNGRFIYARVELRL